MRLSYFYDDNSDFHVRLWTKHFYKDPSIRSQPGLGRSLFLAEKLKTLVSGGSRWCRDYAILAPDPHLSSVLLHTIRAGWTKGRGLKTAPPQSAC